MPAAQLHLPRLRQRLLSASSYLCLALFLADAAQAADQLAVKPAFESKATFRERAFFSLEGGYWLNNSAENLTFDPDSSLLGDLSPLKPGRDGGTFAFAFGYAFAPQWDWAAAYRITALGRESVSTSTNSAANRFRYQHFDLELGYRQPQWQGTALRLFVGPRVLNARNNIHYNYDDDFMGFDKLGNFSHDVDLWGVGPRAGLQATVPLSQSPLSLDVSGSASAIFSRVNRRTTINFFQESPGLPDTGNSVTTDRSTRTVYNLEGSVALGFRPSNTMLLQVGYQAQQWWNLATSITSADGDGRFQSGKSDVLVHGPFAKITVELPTR